MRAPDLGVQSASRCEASVRVCAQRRGAYKAENGGHPDWTWNRYARV